MTDERDDDANPQEEAAQPDDVPPPAPASPRREPLRGLEVWPFPEGYPLPKFMPARQMDGITTLVVPVLPRDPPTLEARAAIAMDWYIKALMERVAANQFISLWVAVETLVAASGYSVSEPLVCPECRKAQRARDRLAISCPVCG